MTHSHYFKKVAQKLSNLSITRNPDEYLRTLDNVRQMCYETLLKYNYKFKNNMPKGSNTDSLVIKELANEEQALKQELFKSEK